MIHNIKIKTVNILTCLIIMFTLMSVTTGNAYAADYNAINVNGSDGYSQYVANAMLNNVTNLDITQYASQTNAPSITEVVNEIVSQNPLLLHYSANTYVEHNHNTGKWILVNVYYNDDSYGIDTMHVRNMLNMKANQIIAAIIKPGMNDYQKANVIDDYITSHYSYDYKTMNAAQHVKLDNNFYIQHPNYQLPVGLLGSYNGIDLTPTVCGGYAKTFKLLADKAGLASIYVSGTVNNGHHAWNRVRINGKWFNVDTTWDDAGNHSNKHYFMKADNDPVIVNRHQVYDKNNLIMNRNRAKYGI